MYQEFVSSQLHGTTNQLQIFNSSKENFYIPETGFEYNGTPEIN